MNSGVIERIQRSLTIKLNLNSLILFKVFFFFLMWTFQAFIEFVTILLLFYVLGFWTARQVES